MKKSKDLQKLSALLLTIWNCNYKNKGRTIMRIPVQNLYPLNFNFKWRNKLESCNPPMILITN